MSLNKQITLKGEFQRAVIINDTLVNGKNCYYTNSSQLYSHAEGYQSKALGLYSHADGVNAVVNSGDNYSYVRSCVNPELVASAPSNGPGTFSIYTQGYSTDESAKTTLSSYALKNIYLNGVQLETIENIYKLDSINTLRTSDNVFTKSLYLSSGSGVRYVQFDNSISFTNNGSSSFNGNVSLGTRATSDTKDESCNDDSVATCSFVHNVVQSYLKNIFGDSVIINS